MTENRWLRTCFYVRKWRNWQTHQLEGLAVAIPWGFESPLSHQPSLACISSELRLASRRTHSTARRRWASQSSFELHLASSLHRDRGFASSLHFTTQAG